ncbi:hypothetical protein V8G57_23845 [Collimonas sp. H4R21]|jgi:hypothetical protein|uniref:Uncharacterized protein n=1 Tax=Collimonas rhizosphaerae TaxID=3126357 RepID=A0ABU9Q2N4_9BURK|nr:hypothetical protein [Collimonas sp. OK412]SFD06724.1 hypothetical protein SAMN04515619_12149 [Collimonas sp. OK412]
MSFDSITGSLQKETAQNPPDAGGRVWLKALQAINGMQQLGQ